MKDWRVIGTSILASLLVAYGWSLGRAEHQCEAARYQSKGRNPPPPLLVTACVGTNQRAEQTQGTGDTSPQRDWPEITSNNALVFVGVITFFSLIWQANETRKAANAAIRQAQIADENMQRTLRAHIGLTAVSVRNLGPDRESLLSLVFQNHGPKSAMLEVIFTAVVSQPLPERPSYEGSEADLIGVPVGANASHQYLIIIRPPMTAETWREISDEGGARRLTIFGVLHYNDGFRMRRVGFRREYSPTLTRLQGNPTFVTVGGRHYNYAD